jgi:hypothetical protein
MKDLVKLPKLAGTHLSQYPVPVKVFDERPVIDIVRSVDDY